MKVNFPCKSYDSEKDGAVWCEWIMNDRNFNCPHKIDCTCLVEDEIDKTLRNQIQKTSAYKKETKEALIKEFEPNPEFAEAI